MAWINKLNRFVPGGGRWVRQPESRFPVWFLTVALALSGSVCVWLAFNEYRSYRLELAQREFAVRYAQLRGSIVHLNEVLTMSALMTVTTGDERWEKRHRQFEPQLDTAINEMLRLQPDHPAIARTAAQTSLANLKRVEMEHRSFDLIRAGQPEAARAVLFSTAYDEQKRTYAAEISRVMDLVADEMKRDEQARLRNMLASMAGQLAVLGTALAVWLAAVGFLGRWRAVVGATVRERTAQLQESETKYRTVFESSSDAIMILSPPSWRFTRGNPAAIRMFRARDEADFTSRAPWEYAPEFQPDGRPSADKAQETIGTAMLRGVDYFEWTHRRLDGQDFPATVLLTRLELGGVTQLQATVRDIAAQKQADRRLRQLAKLQADLHDPATLPEKLKKITDAVVAIVEADFARIWLIRSGDLCAAGCVHGAVTEGGHVCRDRARCLHLLASSGRYTHLDGHGHRRVPFGCYKIGRVASGEEASFLTNDVAHDPRVHNHEWAKELGLVSFAGYQLRPPHGETIGVLALFSNRPISAEDHALLKTLSNLIVPVVQSAQAEAALRERDADLQVTLDSIAAGLVIIDSATHTIVDVNQRAAELFGASKEKLIASICHRCVCPAEKGRCPITDLGQIVDTSERVLLKADGTTIPILKTVVPVTLKGRQCLLESFMDITTLKRAQMALSASEARYRAVLDGAAEGILVADAETRTLRYANPAICRMLGYSLDELLRLSVGDIHPRESLPQVAAVFESHVRGRLTLGSDLQCLRKDGSVFLADITSTRIEFDEKPYLVGFFSDVTERKQAEAVRAEHLAALEESNRQLRAARAAALNMMEDAVASREAAEATNVQVRQEMAERRRAEEGLREQAALLDAANDAIIVRTLDQQVLYWNAGAERLYGWTSTEMVDRRIDEWERIPSPESEAARTALLKEGHWSGELERTSKAGKKLTVFCRFTLLRDDQGRPSRYLAIDADITEKKQLEIQFRQAQKLESVGQLAGGVAHDFNNLLTVILGCSNFLLQDLPPGSMRSDVEQIQKAGEQAVALTRQLLAFSRKQILQPINLDLNNLIAEMGKMLVRLLGEDIDLLSVPGPSLGLVKADPGQVQQVIANLAVNARDAMPQGGKLTIETGNVDIDRHFASRHPMARLGSYVMLAISDSGIGMDGETQAHIFEPFFTTKKPGKGTGLGLSTVYGIVKQSSGFIWVYSEPGKGTTFKIYLPRVRGQAEEVVEGGKSEIGVHGSETVLVVEDAPPVRAFTARSLREKGYTVLEASDGQDALSVAREFAGEIQLAVTDVVMPRMSGREFVSRIQDVRPGIKALYVSGYTGKAIGHHGILDSGIAFLQKPFTADDLARKVREVIESKT